MSTEKKYRLLKDLPRTKAGAILSPTSHGIPLTNEEAKYKLWPQFYSEGGSMLNEPVPISYLTNTEWFKEIDSTEEDIFDFINKMMKQDKLDFVQEAINNIKNTSTDHKPIPEHIRKKLFPAPPVSGNHVGYDKEYEILSFKGLSTDEIYTLDDNEWKCSIIGSVTFLNTDAGIKESGCVIHSIKRVSDNIVFTVGDECYYKIFGAKSFFQITSFYIDEDGVILVENKNPKCHLPVAWKEVKNEDVREKEPLFTMDEVMNIVRKIQDNTSGADNKSYIHKELYRLEKSKSPKS